MQKGENAISVALAAVILLIFLAVHQRWQLASLREAASSAEQLILTTTGLGGEVPEIAGFEKVKTYRLGSYRAALYRVSPAPLLFAPGRFFIYDAGNRVAFRLETLEGSKDAWTTLYDFAGRNGLSTPGTRARPNYTRSLTGESDLNIIVGQYSGGDHCCTAATVLELGKDAVRVLARIEGLDGLPFEGLEVRKVDKDADWELIAHRPYRTYCGGHADAPDLLAVYEFVNGQYVDSSASHADYFQSVLRENLQKWSKEKDRSIQLLQTIAVGYAVTGEREEAKRVFAMGLPGLVPALKQKGVDPNTCMDDVESLLERTASVMPAGEPATVSKQEPPAR
ncbi:MAG: hypothetical protein ACE145_11075 [Terriglobia bacterium]